MFLERKVHQLQTISMNPLAKRLKPQISTSKSGKRMSLMEKSRQEALNSSTRSSSINNGVTFKMRQPSQKR